MGGAERRGSFLSPGSFIKKKYRLMLLGSLLGFVATFVEEMCDAVLAGSLLGEEAVVAVELVVPAFSAIFFMCYFIARGTAAIYSREAGAFRKEKAYGAFGQGLVISLAAGVLITGLMYLLEDFYFSFYTMSAQTEQLSREYYRCICWVGMVFPLFNLLLQMVLLEGDEEVAVSAEVLVTASNFGFSIALSRSMGIAGIGLGSILANIIGILVCLLHFRKKTNSIRLRLAFDRRFLLDMFRLGSASSLVYLYASMFNFAVNKLILGRYGEEYLAAYAVAELTIGLVAVFACPMSAASPFVSVSYGERNPDGIDKVMRVARRYTMIMVVALMTVFVAFSDLLPRLYGITDPLTYEVSRGIGRVLALSFPFTAATVQFSAYYVLTGHTLLGNVMTALYSFLLPAAVMLVLSGAFGFDGLIWGYAVSQILCVLVWTLLGNARRGNGTFPLLLEPAGTHITSYDLEVCPESIDALCGSLRGELSSHGAGEGLTERIVSAAGNTLRDICLEDAEKRIIAECTLMIGSDHVRMIIRDSGEVFDIRRTDSRMAALDSLRRARAEETSGEFTSLTTISFNRNSYLWRRETDR